MESRPRPAGPESLFLLNDRGERIPLPAGARILVGDRPSSSPAPAPAPASADPPAPAPERPRVLAGPPAETRTEELQELISQVPGWLVRWGITLVFIVLVTLLGLSWLVRYPMRVSGELSLTTPSPPVRLVVPGGGVVQRLMVADQERVRSGQWLAVLRNPAEPAHVSELGRRLDALASALSAGAVDDPWFTPDLRLGDVQEPYLAFLQSVSDYRSARAPGYYEAKVQALQQQIAQHESLAAALLRQQTILREEVALAERNRDRNREMLRGQLVTAVEAEQAEAAYLQKRFALENAEGTLAANRIQLTADRTAVLDLERERAEKERTSLLALRASHRALREAITRWEQQYVLRAPVDGKASFFRALSENQYVPASEPVLAVVPSGGKLVGQMTLPHAGAGRVRRGQRVIIRFESFPAAEFGAVHGTVGAISLLPSQRKKGDHDEVVYLVEVALPEGLVTTTGRRLEFRQEMRATADIITQERRLIERLFAQFRQIASRGSAG
jgi:HlyD family secretion protein